MKRRRTTTAVSGVVGLLALVTGLLVTPWCLLVVPLALVFGVAAWRGVGAAAVLDALDDPGADAGRGPAGLGP